MRRIRKWSGVKVAQRGPSPCVTFAQPLSQQSFLGSHFSGALRQFGLRVTRAGTFKNGRKGRKLLPRKNTATPRIALRHQSWRKCPLSTVSFTSMEVHLGYSRITRAHGSQTRQSGRSSPVPRSALPLAQQEPATTVWFAWCIGTNTFGIFDAFGDESGRQAHETGPIAAALMARAPDLFVGTPSIEKLDVLAAKLKE